MRFPCHISATPLSDGLTFTPPHLNNYLIYLNPLRPAAQISASFRNMRPDYIDKSDLPPVGISKVWKYKMMYLFDDEPVGNWSTEAAVTVCGEV